MHKIALQLGPLTITWFGIFAAAGFLAGFWTASRRAPGRNLRAESIADLSTWLIIGAIVGARALYVATYWQEQFAGQPWTEILMVHHGGLVFYGGFAGALLAGYAFARYTQTPFWILADVMAPSIALGHAFGRVGCLMNGCCYGLECPWPWAIHFPADHDTAGRAVHPTQVYEMALNLILYGGLAWIYRRTRLPGAVFCAYLVGYGVIRFGVEFFRGDYAVHYWGGRLTSAQLLSLALMASGGILWFLLRPSGRRSSETRT